MIDMTEPAYRLSDDDLQEEYEDLLSLPYSLTRAQVYRLSEVYTEGFIRGLFPE